MTEPNRWYIVQQSDGQCEIVPESETPTESASTEANQWGPFESKQEAIARRVGLIRAGKCKPV